MPKIKELQDKRQELATKMKAALDAAWDQKAQAWTDKDKQAEYEAMEASYDETKSAIDAQNKADEQAAKIEARRLELDSLENSGDPGDRLLGRDGATLIGNRGDDDIVAGPQAPSDEELAYGLQAFLGHGRSNLTARHIAAAKKCGFALGAKEVAFRLPSNYGQVRRQVRNALSRQDGVRGGFTFGETFVGQLETAMLAFGGVLNVADVIRTSTGEPMRWPTADDTSNSGVMLGEAASVSVATDPTFGQTVWNSYTFSSKGIKVPQSLLRDSAFDLAAVLAAMLGERLGRIQATKYTTGTGASEPKGIVTCAASGVTAASATAITFDEIIDMEHALDPSRRMLPGVGYMFHDNILKALRKLKDGQGLYLWQAGANTGAPDTLNTYPYQISQEMQSSIASGTTTVLFGQLSQFKVRQVGEIRMRRLDELFALTDEVAFLAFIDGDSNLLDAGDHPVKKLVQA